MVHALTLLLITLFFGRWAALIPLATLAAILVIVAYHMSEWRAFRAELRGPKSDAAVLLTTFVLTVVVDLTVAIQVGMVLAAFLFMRRMAETTNVEAISAGLREAYVGAGGGARPPRGTPGCPGTWRSTTSTARSSSAPPRSSGTRWPRSASGPGRSSWIWRTSRSSTRPDFGRCGRW